VPGPSLSRPLKIFTDCEYGSKNKRGRYNSYWNRKSSEEISFLPGQVCEEL
jgi:hypothetical protein